MEIFIRLLFGHFLADFTFQTNFIAHWKQNSMKGLLAHVGIHLVTYPLLIWPFLGDTWSTPIGITVAGWQVVVISVFLHFLEDWFRTAMVNRGWPDNTFFYLWDQMVHILVLWLLSPASGYALNSIWPVVGILFVVVTHFATVTVWFLEKDIYGSRYPETEEKYISMLQRLVVWLFFFLPGPWWTIGPVFAVAIYAKYIHSKKIDFSWMGILLGNLLAIGAGLLARFGFGYHF